MVEIIAFYEFKRLGELRPLGETRELVRNAIREVGVRGTVILAEEGYNGMVCGTSDEIAAFIGRMNELLATRLTVKSSFNDEAPFRKIDVKIKPEIVTLKKPVDMSLADGTHVSPEEWNSVISDPETLVLDTRNHYEYETGTFANAIDPGTEKFSDLPEFVEKKLDPKKHKRIAMFCTGGIRCEKFAPYMKGLGFEQVLQLEGGILKYLEEVPQERSLWNGECFVFDERISVGHDLAKGTAPDHSLRHVTKRTRE